jgi:hypothetical protein
VASLEELAQFLTDWFAYVPKFELLVGLFDQPFKTMHLRRKNRSIPQSMTGYNGQDEN